MSRTAGRPRKPVEQHVDEGTYRADRHGDLDTKMEVTGEPVMDKELPEVAVALWKKLVPLLVKARAAKYVDSVLLNRMCWLYARGKKWDQEIELYPTMDDELMKMERISSHIWTDFNKVAARFGLTPSDRAGLDLGPKVKKGIASRGRK